MRYLASSLNLALLGLCLATAVHAESEELYMTVCSDSFDQQFAYLDDHTLRVAGNAGECLNLDAGDTHPGSHVFMYGSCSGAYNEKWSFGDGDMLRYDAQSDMCVAPYEPEDKSWVYLLPCDQAKKSRFTYEADTKRVRNLDTQLCLTRGMAQVTSCPTRDTYPWCDFRLSVEDRLDLLMANMTAMDKISQMGTSAPALPQFGIPSYNWWSEAAHGVLTGAPVTSFPTSPAMAATRNLKLTHDVASAISDEGRAIHNAGRTGLTFFAPNINIVRDPRWGRGQETYGEDPFLTGRFVKQFVKGMQEGYDQEYIKVIATPKHYAAYSLEHWNGTDRTAFDAVVSDLDLFESYFPAFEAAVKEGGAYSVMCSYNAVNGVPSCANDYLLQTMLRDTWGFEGYVVSDCDAVANVWDPHHYGGSPEGAAAKSLLAGTDLDCGSFYTQNLPTALEKGLIKESDIDKSFRRLFYFRFKLGMFDPPEKVSYNRLNETELASSKKHLELAFTAAKESVVLLANDAGLLPLNPETTKTVALVGPNADNPQVLLGNYNGSPTRDLITTYRDGLNNLGLGLTVKYAEGSPVTSDNSTMVTEAVDLVKGSDVAVVVVGLNLDVEQEGHDRTEPNIGIDMKLTGSQEDLVKQVIATGVPTVVVLVNGDAVTLEDVDLSKSALVETFYGGQRAGDALAQILFGFETPSGHLPYTVLRSSWAAATSFGDMSMHAGRGRTYKFVEEEDIVYPFGHGLSYTTFDYDSFELSHAAVDSDSDATLTLTGQLTNSGTWHGAEVVQVFAQLPDSRPDSAPKRRYVGFEKVYIGRGETATVTVKVRVQDLATAVAGKDGAVSRVVLPGTYSLQIFGGGTTWTQQQSIDLAVKAADDEGALSIYNSVPLRG